MENLASVNQKIEILDRKTINVSGVEEILSSTEKEVFVKIEKEILQILGEGMKIVKLVPEEKSLVVSGLINGIMISSRPTKKSIFGKVFK